MKSVIIYKSQTGFTKQYATWLAKDMGAEMIAIEDAKFINYQSYDQIVFASWCHAGKFKKLDWLKKIMEKNPDKKYTVIGVGASQAEAPEVAITLENSIPKDMKNCRIFYCPGGLRYEKMSFLDRKLMNMLSKMLKKKKDATESEKIMAEMICHDYDIQDQSYLEPVKKWMHNDSMN